MATLGSNYLSLIDLGSRTDKNKQIAEIIEQLAQTNPIVEDAVVLECNNGSKHLTTIRTGIPTPTWRRLYEGVQPTKSTTTQVEDTTGMLETWSEIDAKLVEMSNDRQALRFSESGAFIEGMNQEFASTFFYGDTATDPEEFMGLGPRFDDLSAENGQQIVDGGGTGSDNTSMWFVVWGERSLHLIYPQGSMGGVQRDDKGKQTKENSGLVFDVYREKFTWDVGMSVRDWRYISRIANIDVSDLNATATSSSADLHDLMVTAYYKLHQRKIPNGKSAIYCNTTIKEYLHKQALQANTNTFIRVSEVDGEEKISFLGMPIREVDAILNTEAQIS